ncbi:hypothetical protein DACRYDRAFT_22381 [Dacryopinax primogenitus]|uniref:Uncharacterized protein n=1 Tax=Dacryopinax primogenitus (strain DJM 731) TaxID=1858805 RepID=M5G7V1_DACPD|nr:uncharacterized protein DACRYDRAFT_22381 [Dacryopinax primogenitus]EJU01962.1 hypothetical protein DACRYDRAFT_22381 [Dacryopinax primogenitus]
MWAEIFASCLEPRTSYLKSRRNVTTVAQQPYDDAGISLLEFALLAQTAARLYPTLPTVGLPCRWTAHVLFRAMAALASQPLPAAYIGRIKGFDDRQVDLVVQETNRAMSEHRTRTDVERLECGMGVEKKVRERVMLIGLSSARRAA